MKNHVLRAQHLFDSEGETDPKFPTDAVVTSQEAEAIPGFLLAQSIRVLIVSDGTSFHTSIEDGDNKMFMGYQSL